MFSSTRCSGNSAGLLRCRVTSPGKLPSPLKLLSSLFCGVTALARSWTSLVGFVVRVQRAGFQVSLARVGARRYEFRSTRELQEKKRRERARRSCVVLNSPFFWTSPKVAGPIRVSVWGEAPPARLLLQGIFHAVRNNFYPCIKTLIRFTHYNITFVILLIHIILQPFIKV